MKYPTLRFIFDRKKVASETNPGAVSLEICHERRQKRVVTGVKVLPSQWDDVNGVVNHPDAVKLNLRLAAFRKSYDDVIAHLMIEGEPFTFVWLDQALNKHKYRTSFVKYIQDRLNARRDIKKKTRLSHQLIIPALKSFNKINEFKDLHPVRIRAFDEWLHNKGYKQSTIAKYHKILKVYINAAIAEGLINNNPYTGIRISKGENYDRKYLEEEDIRKIMKHEYVDQTVSKARDLFVFQLFTGLSYIDMCRFRRKDVEIVDGNYRVNARRQKTGRPYHFVLLKPAIDILKKYKWKLPIMPNQNYNAALKSVGVVIGKSVTSHMARHTFATWCLNNGVPIATLAEMMGHADIKTTMIYAKITRKTLDSTCEKLNESISMF